MKICVDPGHGGHDPGAIGMGGTREKDIVLIVGKLLKEALSLRHQVFMTRDRDVFIPLSTRATISNKAQADAFVSVHCNGFSNPLAHGWEIFTSPGQTRADTLATAIYRSWIEVFPGVVVRADWSDGDVDKERALTVLVRTQAPAVLVEIGFITNPVEEAWVSSFSNQKQIAETIARGLNNWDASGRGH